MINDLEQPWTFFSLEFGPKPSGGLFYKHEQSQLNLFKCTMRLPDRLGAGYLNIDNRWYRLKLLWN